MNERFVAVSTVTGSRIRLGLCTTLLRGWSTSRSKGNRRTKI